MALLGKLRTIQGDRLGFWCPGCESMHVVSVGPGVWTWNGNADAPTFTPSVLCTSGHFLHGDKPGNCYCDLAERMPEVARETERRRWRCMRCHSFVTDGKIQFLGDCTHALANSTVDLPACPSWDD